MAPTLRVVLLIGMLTPPTSLACAPPEGCGPRRHSPTEASEKLRRRKTAVGSSAAAAVGSTYGALFAAAMACLTARLTNVGQGPRRGPPKKTDSASRFLTCRQIQQVITSAFSFQLVYQSNGAKNGFCFK